MEISDCKTETKDNLGEFTIREKLLGWKNKLKVHLRKNPDDKSFICDVCSKIFSCIGDLTLHMNYLHNIGKSYECGVCQRRFARKKNVMAHLKMHIETFITQRELTIHAMLHTGEKPFKCDTCLVRIKQKGNMLAHVRSPPKEKRFICEICKKKFTRDNHLAVHTVDSKIHPGYEPFECNICSKKFTAKGMLNKHKTVHARETRTKFPPEATLTNHMMKMQTKDKSLIRCDTCLRKFNIVAIRHSKLQSDKLYECDFCQKTFTTDKLDHCELPLDCEVEEKINDRKKLKEECIIDDNSISEFNTLDIEPLEMQRKTEIDSVNIERLTVKLEK